MIERGKERSPSLKKCAKFLMTSTAEQFGKKKLIGSVVSSLLDLRAIPSPRLRKHNNVPSIALNSTTDPLEEDLRPASREGEQNDPLDNIESVLDMRQCSVAEKIQRWNGTIENANLPTRNHETTSRKNTSESSSRVSIDSGNYSLTVARERDPDENMKYCRLESESDTAIQSLTSEEGIEVESIDSETLNENRHRTLSASSEASSTASGPQEEDVESIQRFMHRYVDMLFTHYKTINRAHKDRFGRLTRTPDGRSAFAKALNDRRSIDKKVDDETLLSLELSLALMLFECSQADDFSSGKILMNMCFTFYTEDEDSRKRILPQTGLSTQTFWKKQAFWKGMFYEALVTEQRKFILSTTSTNGSTPSRVPDKQTVRECLRNATFGLLGTFTHNMQAMNLPKSMCLKLFNDEAVIGDLTEAQVQQLQEHIEFIYSQ